MRRKFHILKRKDLNATRIVAGSFAVIIILGAVLLSLPAASNSGEAPGVLTGLFTATSATCVTGLVVVDTATQWSLFGQVVILCMIQLGGLGFITVMTLFSLTIRRKIGLSERLIMVSSLNLSSMGGVVQLVRYALKWTVIFEGCGAVLLATRFIPLFGLAKGLWFSVFHAVSAFCNAGFDILGEGAPFRSIARFSGDPVVLFTLMCLIVIGGLGFFVWMDIGEKKSYKGLTLYSKMVLVCSAVLIILGTVIIFAVEYHNPNTLGPMPLWQKGLNALFQSVSYRTAGFAVLDQGMLRDSTMGFGSLFMLIGGSSGSTAGGLKTVTITVLILGLWADLRGRRQLVIRGKAISQERRNNAVTLTLTVLVICFLGSMLLSLLDSIPFVIAGYEVASALGTVGLSAGVTPGLSPVSQGFIALCMYLGRVGILSFSIAFATRRQQLLEGKIKYPTTDVMIG